jgi:hypothetical protein
MGVFMWNEVMNCDGIELRARVLYRDIYTHIQEDGLWWKSDFYFADMHEVDVSTIRRWLKSLESKGFVREEAGKKTLIM